MTRNPCEWEQNRCNHGKCRVRDGKPVCQCNPGYSGDKCQISKFNAWRVTSMSVIVCLGDFEILVADFEILVADSLH